jgi:hypothetical protein
MDALSQLEKWVRKHYTFEISCGPNVQPGEGFVVKLHSPARTVEVGETELETQDADGGWVSPSLSEVIEEAMRRWHADDRTKLYQVCCNDKRGFPAGLAERILFKLESGHSLIEVVARTETDVRDKFELVYAGQDRLPAVIHSITEWRLL